MYAVSDRSMSHRKGRSVRGKHHLVSTERVHVMATTNALNGNVQFVPSKAVWLGTHSIAGITGVALFPHWDAALVFIILTAITICAGHSVGMHRLLIHSSFKTSRTIRNALVWLGTLVGMAGPFGMIEAHDMRDWHQRQEVCPAHPAHEAGFWRDAFWQLFCIFRLHKPPRFEIEKGIVDDPILATMERTWMLQQLPVALLLYLGGGLAWVLWGCCLRVSVSLIGHWLVGHYAHQDSEAHSFDAGLPVKGRNLPGLGWLTFGENWHGNHHACPNSARLGFGRGQWDPGYTLVRTLQRAGLAWDVMEADTTGSLQAVKP